MNFSRWNNITGWSVFLIAAVTYLSTIEPTASWWDCGEFVATSYKLMVGHPPGAPIFQFIAKFFTLFSFGDEMKVAATVNALSGISTAFAALFLFWSTTMLLRKFMKKDDTELGMIDQMVVLVAATIGSLAFVFSDSIWFSAVEAEVYALTIFFTSITFWGILRWENGFGNPGNGRWILFVAFIIGMSIGVHILNLLIIPTICFVIALKYRGVSFRTFMLASIASVLLLGFLYLIIYTGSFKIMALFELLLVNTFGMPFNSGVWFTVVFTFGIIVFLIWYTTKKNLPKYNLLVISFYFFYLGQTSYLQIILRAQADITINENRPDSPFELLNYLNREQYGSKPIFYGPQFNTQIVDLEKKGSVYKKIDGKYQEIAKKTVVKYDPKKMYFIPRMFGRKEQDLRLYDRWTGESIDRKKGPTFAQNLKYIFAHQFGFMNFRYLMWNFSGRQNDNQSTGSVVDGNWLTGIPFIDERRLGDTDNLPEKIREHKARNTFFMIPFLIGILGMVFFFTRKKQYALVVMISFLSMGLVMTLFGIIFAPLEPRERDYVYSGEFLAFAIFISVGVVALYETFSKYISQRLALSATALITTLSIPLNMAAQGWDDHDRSGRTLTRDIARNYLASCPKNAILITFGDNDTFPLWYVQEVEGFRTDVKVLVTSYLNTDWYIDQARRKTYEAPPLRMILPRMSYAHEKRSQVPVLDKIKQPVDIQTAMKFVASDDQKKQVRLQGGESISYFPSKSLKVHLEVQKMIQNQVITDSDSAIVSEEFIFNIPGKAVPKGDLAIYDMIASNISERPFCFTSPPSKLGLHKQTTPVGLVYQLMPLKPNTKSGGYNIEKNYKILMEELDFSNYTDDIHIDWENRKLFMVLDLRSKFSRLASELVKSGNTKKAEEVLDKAVQAFPYDKIPIPSQMISLAQVYYQIGKTEKAQNIMKTIYEDANQVTSYYLNQEPYVIVNGGLQKAYTNLDVMGKSVQALQKYDTALYKEFAPIYEKNKNDFVRLQNQE